MELIKRKGMGTLNLVLLCAAIFDAMLLIADIIVLNVFCDAGYFGYDDTWKSDTAEKAHRVLCTSQLTLSMLIVTACVVADTIIH